MLTIVKGLILACMLMIIAGGMGAVPRWVDIPVFIASMGLVYLYWRLSYWVSDKMVGKSRPTSAPVLFSVFAGKVPAIAEDDLLRGRLIISQGRIELYKRTRDRKNPCVLAWEIPADTITSVSFGKVTGSRSGFTLHTADDQISFTCASIGKHKQELFSALGWKIEN